MAEIRVPTLGESVTEATIGKWFKKAGDAVAVDEPLVELETDKVTIEVPAPAAGVLAEIAAKDGETVAVGALLGQIKEGAGAPPRRPRRRRAGRAGQKTATAAPTAPPPRSRAPQRRRRADAPLAPSVRKIAAESGMDPADGRRLRQGRPRHQGRHDGGDRARRGRADAGRRSRPPPCRCARRRRPTTPRARSA